MAGTVTGASDYPHGCEGSGEGNVDSRQPLQKSSICISGGGTERIRDLKHMSTNARILYKHQVPL